MSLRPLDGGWLVAIDRTLGWVRDTGRDPVAFGNEGRLTASAGTPDEWGATVDGWRGLGATYLSVGTANGGLRGPDAHIQRLREVREVLGS